MTSRGRGRVAAVAVVVAMGAVWCLPGGSPAAGAAPERQGWWKAAGPLSGIGIGAVPGLGELGAPDTADVPDDGLLVAGDPAGGPPQAIAALAHPIGDSRIAGPLRLVPDPAAASVPGSAVMACPLDAPEFEAAQGGPIEAAPAFDCFGGVAATVGEDGAYLFDVTTVVRGSWLAVAIVPAAATARVVFAAPGDDALPLDDAAPSGGGDDVVATEPVSSSGSVSVSAPSTGSLDVGGGSFAVEAPPAADLPAGPPPQTGATTTPPASSQPVSEPTLAASSGDDGNAGRAYLLVGLAALAGLLWTGAGTGVLSGARS